MLLYYESHLIFTKSSDGLNDDGDDDGEDDGNNISMRDFD